MPLWVNPPWLHFPSSSVTSPTEGKAIARHLISELMLCNKELEIRARANLLYTKPKVLIGVCGPQLGIFKRVYILLLNNSFEAFVNPKIKAHSDTRIETVIRTPLGTITRDVWPWVSVARSNGPHRLVGFKRPDKWVDALTESSLCQYFLELFR